MEIIIPTLHKWQRDVYDAVTNDSNGSKYIVKARRQCGKSFLARVLLLVFALTNKTVNICVEPTLNQSRRMFKQLEDMLGGSGIIKTSNSTLLTMEFVNKSELIFKSAEQKESLRGMTCTGIMIIDEGAFIPDDIYEILFPCLDAHNAPLLVISTPLFCSGMFYNLYNSQISFNWSDYDTSIFLPNDRLEEYKKQLTPNKFKSEYLGEFITDGSYVFKGIRACIKPYNEPNGKIYIGIDWGAGQGQDSTVVTFMDETYQVFRIESTNKLSPTEQIDTIAKMLNDFKPYKVMVEQNSIGNIYYDMLKKKTKANIVKFNTTNESKRRIIEQLSAAISNGYISIPNDEELIKQLEHYEMEKTSRGYTYNAPSGYHDDYVMSLAIAYDAVKNNNGNYTIKFI